MEIEGREGKGREVVGGEVAGKNLEDRLKVKGMERARVKLGKTNYLKNRLVLFKHPQHTAASF